MHIVLGTFTPFFPLRYDPSARGSMVVRGLAQDTPPPLCPASNSYNQLFGLQLTIVDIVNFLLVAAQAALKGLGHRDRQVWWRQVQWRHQVLLHQAVVDRPQEGQGIHHLDRVCLFFSNIRYVKWVLRSKTAKMNIDLKILVYFPKSNYLSFQQL